MDPRRIQRILRQHVQTDKLLGVTSVPVGASRVEIEVAEEVEAAAPPEPEAEQPAPARVVLPPERVALFKPVLAGDAPPPLDRAVKLQLLTAMEADEVRGCTKCPLHRGRIRTVFGEGDADAKIMFIGEGPGQTEDEQGRPFVGAAGELLDKMIVAMGITREAVYIANVVKCRPPNNRVPLPPEVDACWGYLKRQIEVVQPRVLVTLGGAATKVILQTERGITSIRGIWAEYRGGPVIPVMPTFHPAYLLRSYTTDNRRKVWSDLQKVMEAVG